ncbi:hypothetical protein C2S52_013426 [Perilla frutescens var. hirtella]|nr:hypothetical protein C2S52_013426 [Perilla frutescens var. hirtella]
MQPAKGELPHEVFVGELPTSRFVLLFSAAFPLSILSGLFSNADRVKHTQWPFLRVGITQRPNYLPTEIITFLKLTCQRPQEREYDTLQTVNHNVYANYPYAIEFGIYISEKLAQRGRGAQPLSRSCSDVHDIWQACPAYDGRKSLFMAGPLPFASEKFKITLIDEEEYSRREREFKVVIKFWILYFIYPLC